MNETNITDILNQTITTPPTVGIGEKILGGIGSVTDFIKNKIADFGVNYSSAMSTLLLIFIALVMIVLGTKVANKVAKFLLLIVGIILMIGTIYSLFN